ncbi:MAG TPA: hypothetical protein PLK80_12045 [bacterium]|nr:MAG: hypothetical protein BWY28_02696 [bacterium ADurb.Bin236]HOY64843.1 hypothetical protein [bacterium]HPI77455.1 hypothetical protein [bacterium]HPN94808.1 hypothetical protein [bacterium]
MRKIILLLMFVALSVCSGMTALAEQSAPASLALPSEISRFNIKDIYGRIIPAEQLKDWIVVYGFGNENNAMTMVGWLKEITLAYPDTKGIMFICIAETSKYPKVMGPMVRRVLKKEYEQELETLGAKLAEKGFKQERPLDEKYIMIADTSGAYYNHFGIGDGKDDAHVFIFDGDHVPRAYFSDYSEEMKTTLASLLAEREEKQRFAAIQMSAKKKNTFRKYALIGAAVAAGVLLLD